MNIAPLTPDEIPGPVAVITGGTSRERDRSLLSGAAVAASLTRHRIPHYLVDPAGPDLPGQLRGASCAFLAIAGTGAEDGLLQGVLDTLGVPYTGSGVLASAIGMHKPTAKTVVAAEGVPVADGELVSAGTTSFAWDDLGWPVIVKPVSEGGSVGMAIARDETELAAIVKASTDDLLVERLHPGLSVTVGVIENEGSLVALPPLEARTPTTGFYSYEAKRNPALHEYVCPARVPAATRDLLHTYAIITHEALGCSTYSRSDFMVDEDGAIVWLEVNTLPGLSPTGNMATMAQVAGIDYDQLVALILRPTLARVRKEGAAGAVSQ
ncbi:D-alanine--D-alanine ligase [Nocardiopsis sp. CT-R113]|uniref:D-alanine--D-alanine ligase n=1 Tax=Nocardiopsis codii TaxID=3065942 RepID=A0ABU7KE13_9ACTN|nr:D-alanine--D-alanine ligase [Nocardiopsis sp. CT-R113]MEE2040154.1 D-alanine--D-alanine ligase [Nocardiopsis sp. CT-R113]